MKSSQTSDDTMHSVTLARLVEVEPWKMWPTPLADDTSMRTRKFAQGGTPLSMAVGNKEKTWPTPASRDYKGSNGLDRTLEKLDEGGRAHMGQLPNAVMVSEYERKNWPTPDANMGARGTQPEWKTTRESGQHAQYPINHAVRDKEGNGQLNPDWVEWLMGWPVGWTSLEQLESITFQSWDIDPADTGEVPRVGTNIADRAKRLKAIGNGQVPLTAAIAFSILSQGLL